ncbi:hypothetical protein BJY52DRAFT_1291682 [Lactarius psammicola]|nr:hypothetical protein BJY52DRAFT_1315625 [Lactarius psammicola]KAI9452757.1 hypothetical protein BJY52DRAFT_1291682 [Lactarius psammicola]
MRCVTTCAVFLFYIWFRCDAVMALLPSWPLCVSLQCHHWFCGFKMSIFPTGHSATVVRAAPSASACCPADGINTFSRRWMITFL